MEFSYASDDIRELAKALLNVQRQLQPAIKDAVNPFVKNKYATLNSIMDCCRSVLIDNGILLVQHQVPAEPEYCGIVTWQKMTLKVLALPVPMGDAMLFLPCSA